MSLATQLSLLASRIGVEFKSVRASVATKVAKTGDTLSGALLSTAGGQVGAGVQPLTSTGYVQSRGQDLITNGSGLLGNNYNFSAWTYDTVNVVVGGGSFRCATYNANFGTDELIPVDGTKFYKFSLWAKATTYVPGSGFFAGLTCYDADGLQVSPQFFMRNPGSNTTLAAPLNPGDTTITLTSAAGWYNGGGNAYYRNLVWYGYANAKGYVYPDYTYSRLTSYNTPDFATNGLWAAGGIVGNVITLRAPWAGPALPAGAAVANNLPGGTYKYIAASGAANSPNWVFYSGKIGGWDLAGANGNPVNGVSQFPYGTAFVRGLFLCNRDVAGVVTNISGVSLTQLTVENLDPAPVFGFVRTMTTGMGTAMVTVGTANYTRYVRVVEGGTISKIRLVIGVSSGNIAVAVYANTGVGLFAAPGARVATSGSVACPAAGGADVSLGASVVVAVGDWLAIGADNVTATFAGITGVGDGAMSAGQQGVQVVYPPPAVAALSAQNTRMISVLGVP